MPLGGGQPVEYRGGEALLLAPCPAPSMQQIDFLATGAGIDKPVCDIR